MTYSKNPVTTIIFQSILINKKNILAYLIWFHGCPFMFLVWFKQRIRICYIRTGWSRWYYHRQSWVGWIKFSCLHGRHYYLCDKSKSWFIIITQCENINGRRPNEPFATKYLKVPPGSFTFHWSLTKGKAKCSAEAAGWFNRCWQSKRPFKCLESVKT